MSTIQKAVAQDTAENGSPESIKEAIRERLETAKAKASEGYDKLSEKAHEVWDKAADTSLNDVQASVKRYVRHNPGKSLLMAAGAGLIIGLAIRGHRR